jgi:hypothetical protein
MRKKDVNFASLCFTLKQKSLNRSKANNLKRKKTKKKRKKAKKHKKSEKTKKSEKKRKNRLEFRFAFFHYEAKITKVKRSEKFEAKRSKKK